jgi:hypothetical protein
MSTRPGNPELRRRLREGDPVAAEPPPSSDDMQRVRRAMLAAAGRAPARSGRYATLALAATLMVAAALGVAAARQFAAGRAAAVPPAAGAAGGEDRTQLQFSTPGGTRIIWTIDPAFRLREAP